MHTCKRHCAWRVLPTMVGTRHLSTLPRHPQRVPAPSVPLEYHLSTLECPFCIMQAGAHRRTHSSPGRSTLGTPCGNGRTRECIFAHHSGIGCILADADDVVPVHLLHIGASLLRIGAALRIRIIGHNERSLRFTNEGGRKAACGLGLDARPTLEKRRAIGKAEVGRENCMTHACAAAACHSIAAHPSRRRYRESIQRFDGAIAPPCSTLGTSAVTHIWLGVSTLE
jgi:hypothetical protein